MTVRTSALITVDSEAELSQVPAGCGLLVAVLATGQLYVRSPLGTFTERPSADVLVPSGIVLLWSGDVEEIPAGWRLCDGSNGAPDMKVAGNRDNTNYIQKT